MDYDEVRRMIEHAHGAALRNVASVLEELGNSLTGEAFSRDVFSAAFDSAVTNLRARADMEEWS